MLPFLILFPDGGFVRHGHCPKLHTTASWIKSPLQMLLPPFVGLVDASAAKVCRVALLPSSLWHGDWRPSVWMHVVNKIGRQLYWDSRDNSLGIRRAGRKGRWIVKNTTNGSKIASINLILNDLLIVRPLCSHEHGRCCISLAARDSQRESIRLNGVDE
ncbi:hypothetical protein SAMN06265380_10331 [Ruegeria faecimaris]|uniref:Uncharacterized protein n=1 Tax=Ruegeria faecimaris TaxID=686389 RepID=A0A521CLC5_9RHOB|nr:hypothetical protein SAMN06265380_10331 [Ruegeria faecimaris]